LWITAAALLLSHPCWAAGPAAPVAPQTPVSSKGSGQAELRARFEAGVLQLVACASANCAQSNAKQVPLPPEVTTQIGTATLTVVQLGQGRQAILARVPVAEGEQAWQALVATATDGSAQAKVLWSGMTGWVEGEIGERHGPMLSVRGNTVLIGEAREDIQLCGRPTILSARAVVPTDLSLRPAKVQQLGTKERAAAPKLLAKADVGSLPTGSPLRAVAASSAVGSPQALTDGNPATYWGEHRGEDGRGEFITVRAAKDLGLSGLALQIHPGPNAPVTGTAPKELWLATDDALYQVTLPDKAWQATAPRLRVDFPAPVHTSCLALVLERGQEAKVDSQVIVSELWGITTLGQNWEEVTAQLDQGAERAAAAVEALSFGGDAAYAAVAKAMPTLSPAARTMGLQVLDQAPCNVAAPVYWSLADAGSATEDPQLPPSAARPDDPEISGPGQRRLQRCRREISELLLASIEPSKGARRAELIEQLAGLAPVLLVQRAPQWLARAALRERKALRDALQVAADAPDAEGALRAVLRDETLSTRVQLQLLRALAPRAQRFAPEYAAAFRRQAQQAEQARAGEDFERRFLLLQPAGALATLDPSAADYLRKSLQKAGEWELRGEAAQRANVTLFARELIAASRDPEVRVRLAAVEAMGPLGAASVGPLLERLTEDEWPMVRVEAIRSLLPNPDRRVNAALAEALADEARQVRRTVVFALGQRGVRNQAPALRDLLQDDDEDVAVRAAAALSLGQLCDATSAEALTAHARRLGSLTLSEAELVLGRAGLQGLALLKPKDIERRLAPLLDPKAPAAARRLARQALQMPSQCSTGVTPRKKVRSP
jgi:HEAT repeat protein